MTVPKPVVKPPTKKPAKKPPAKKGSVPGVNAATFSQPVFDPRIRRLSAPFGDPGSHTPIQRGHMAWDPVNAPAKTNLGKAMTWATVPKVFFLYNPSTVAASYSMSDTTAQTSSIFPTTTNQPILKVPIQQQIGFTLMFDRTYEMMTATTQDPMILQWGCEADVMAMKQFTGMFINPSSIPGGAFTGTNTATGTGVGIQQGIMLLIFSYVYFGVPGIGLQYYGYIDSWDVQYTHFAQDMRPMRCVVDVSFTLLPPPAVAPGDTAGAAQQATDPSTGAPNPAPGAGGRPGPGLQHH